MSTLQPTPDTPTDPWALVDGCPECVANVEPPWFVTTVELSYLCAYHCTDCGHSWSTSWGV